MSGGGVHGFRVSTIPSNVRKMIQNIKEIICNHSEVEIYAMLKECGMDPNETVQKLLLQDTFHEVKRKRDKKNLNNRETVDTRWRSGPPGRVGRRGHGNVSAHHPDADGGKHSISSTENGIKQASESAVSNLPAPAAKDVKIKETASASITSAKHPEVSSAEQSLGGATESSVVASGPGTTNENIQPQPSSSKSLDPAAWTSGGHRSTSDPVLVRSKESRPPGAIGAIKHEIGSQRSRVEPNSNASAESKLNAAHEIRGSSAHAKVGSKSHEVGKNQHAEFSRPSSSSGHAGSSSRPSSNYGNRSQQVIGPPKGINKEWKPKAINSSNVLVSRTSAAPEQSCAAPEQSCAAPEQSCAAPEQSCAAPEQSPADATKTGEQDIAVHDDISGSEEPASKVEKELEGLHIRDAQHVIIPNHIHAPEAVRTTLTFGSFEAAVVIGMLKGSEHTSKSCQVIEDLAVEQAVSDDNVVPPSEEEESIDHTQSTHVPENVSVEADIPSSTSSFPQDPAVQTSSAYSFPVVPAPVVENTTPVDSSDSQARDASRAPSFVVQQPIDPATASFYAQFYWSGEGDGRISPFHSSGVTTKHNTNAALLSAQTSESTQEGGNPMAMSTTGQAPTNQAGLMPSDMALAQQALPVFRQPPGLPMSHYPPNYMPYGHYFSPYYVQPRAIHQFLGNNAFLQQAQAGSVYPGPPTGAAAVVKYPLAQFKPGSNSGNPTHMGVTANYGPYGTSPVGYNTGSAAAAGNSTNEDLAGSQYKEHNVYTAGQQTEGSAVWITAPGLDITGLQANSFYNLPQGQHMDFTPPQAGHGSFSSMYHPAQAVTAVNVHPVLQQSQAMSGAVDMRGAAPGSVYQQPQHQHQHATQMNWPNNY